MATESVKTTAITNLDAKPPVRTTNYGATSQQLFGTATFATAVTSGSTYLLARLPSHARLHSLLIWLDASVTTFTGDITLYYSDTWQDGTDANAGTGAVAAHIYKTAYAMASLTAPTEVYMGGNITGANLGKRLWEDAGLSTDPGGMFDIVIVTTATNSGTSNVNAAVRFASN